MDPFVRKLVERLCDPAAGLSRNRHFHTFDNEEGRAALKITKRLKALASDIDGCRRAGGTIEVSRSGGHRGGARVEVQLTQVRSRRTTRLEPAEYDLLLALPGVREALEAARPSGSVGLAAR
jgi:hypothetical protein